MGARDRDPPPRGRPRPVRGASVGLAVRTGRLFGLTSPRRLAAVALLVGTLALSVAVPLQNYVAVQSQLVAVRAEQDALRDQVDELERRRALLEDPAHVEAQARERLRYVRPGETPYIVQLPPPPPPRAVAVAAPEPWYTRLWRSIVSG